MLSFQLSDTFIQKYVGKPEFANPLAAVTFYRTYSRPKDDGTYENWLDVCKRCIEGMYSIQKDYCNKHRKSWSDNKATRSAEEAFDRMFHHKWSPPGRGMWVMGTPLIHKHGIIESLNNCGFVSTKNIKHDEGYVFQWAMNALMLGIGIGFDAKGANKIKVGTPHSNANIIVVIGDSRESWADSVRILVNSYLNSTYTVEFDYSQIRAAGSPIKRFGGTSSGPEPLIKLHQRIRNYLDRNSNETLTSQTIVDIYNAIGACVIAGNVRRSAEIAIGEIDDKDFLDLKNSQIHPERQDVAWASNNSIFAELGSAYNEIAERIIKNGEPGLNWMRNVNNYGRMNGTQDTNDKAVGFNPCFSGDTMIWTYDGHRRIKDLVNKRVQIFDGIRWVYCDNFRVTGENQETLRIKTEFSPPIVVTPYHTMILENGTRILASDLKVGDKLSCIDMSDIYGEKHNVIESISSNGILDKVYCCTVDTTHSILLSNGIITGQCSEQALESFELCTLADVYIDAHTDLYDFHRSIKFAYLYAKTVTLLSEQITDPNTKAVMKRNRRIGLSLSGITKFVANNNINTLVKYMETGYEYVKHYDMRYSEWFGINRSNRMTTIKPGGTTGLVAATTPGIHYPHSEYYIRRIRLQENTPLVFILEAAGIKIEKDVYSDNTVVAEFPIHAGDNIESAKNVNMWRQLGLTALAQKYWSDNGVSVTVSFNPVEVKANDIAAALDIYQYQLKSVSFLPEIDGGSYQQMPYEEISKERYDEIVTAINFDVFSTLGEYMNDSNKVADLYCSNASCTL